MKEIAYQLCINCRSLCANFTQLKLLQENLEFSIDVIALTETWLNENKSNVFSLDGYEFCHSSRKKERVEELDCLLKIIFILVSLIN